MYIESTTCPFAYIDFGDGTLLKLTIGTGVSASGKLTGSVVKVYNSSVTSFECNEMALSNIDISKCTSLALFHCWFNRLNELDISTNTELVELQFSHNEISSITVSKNLKLAVLSCGSNKLTDLDVSKNKALVSLQCSNNQLSKLDVSNNILIENLYFDGNNLTSLDISKNMKLVSLTCKKNRLRFSSLPLFKQEYSYAPQDTLTISKDIAVGSVLDLSSEYSVGGNTTVYTWISTSGDTLVAGTDYSIAEGKTTFLRTRTDSVFCAMENASFSQLSGINSLKTTAIKVLAKQSITFAALPSSPAIGASIQLSATASTGAAVTYTSSDPSVASISGTTLTIHKAGTVTITATVAATDVLASAEATQNLSIAPVTEARVSDRTESLLYPTVAAEAVYLRGEALPQATGVSVFNANGQLVLQGTLQQGRLDVSALPAGQYLLKTNSAADQQIYRFVKQ